jgi:hypothetical protein
MEYVFRVGVKRFLNNGAAFRDAAEAHSHKASFRKRGLVCMANMSQRNTRRLTRFRNSAIETKCIVS